MRETAGLISMIVPVFNAKPYLKRCVDSLRKQTHTELEILLVDDGSADGSAELCDNLTLEDSRIRVFHQKNAGVSAARNTGLEMAEGDFVSFVDADDWIEEDMLSHLLLLLEKEQADVAVCGFYECDSFEEAFIHSVLRPAAEGAGGQPAEGVQTVPAQEYLLSHVLHGDTRCWSKLYSRAAIGEARFRESLTIGEDMLFFMDLLPHLSRIAVTDYKGYFYFSNEQGAMAAPFRESYLDQITCWQEARARIPRTETAAWKRVNAILAVSVLLVVNKLALLPGRQRRLERDKVRLCRAVLREALSQLDPPQDLENRHHVKAGVFLAAPGLYMTGYRWGKGLQKRREERRRQEESDLTGEL